MLIKFNQVYFLVVIFNMINLLLSFFSALCYRLGGSAKENRWYKFLCNTKTRDIGCSLISCFTLIYNFGYHWSLIIVFGLMWASFTTYFKPKGTEAKWYHWIYVGLVLSLSILPYIYFKHLWMGFEIHLVIKTFGIMMWSEKTGNAVREELGRGFINNISLLFLGL